MATSESDEERRGRARVHGLGGVFFRSADPEATRRWYQDHLGLAVDDCGSSFAWRRDSASEQRAFTLWSPFEAETEYFGNDDQQFMINFRVDDLDGLLAQLAEVGIKPVSAIETQPHGRFVHIIDNDGRRIELWEPVDDEYEQVADGTTPS